MLRVSVVTPTMNAARHLEACLKNVRNQNYHAIEHFVADGGSTDGTIAILQSTEGLKWLSEPDAGMYDAINKGIRNTTGDIVGYLNADDEYEPDTIRHVVAAFERHSDVELVYGHCIFTDERGRELFTIRALPFVDRLTPTPRIAWSQPTCFWRRRLHDRVGFFDTSFKNVGDYEFWARVLTAGVKCRLLPRPLARFMLRPDCLSNQAYARNAREREEVARRYGMTKIRSRDLPGEFANLLLNLPSYYQRFRWNRQSERQQLGR